MANPSSCPTGFGRTFVMLPLAPSAEAPVFPAVVGPVPLKSMSRDRAIPGLVGLRGLPGDPGAAVASLRVPALNGACCRLRRSTKAMACNVSSDILLPLSWQSISEWFAWMPVNSALPPSGPRSFQLRSRWVRVLFSRSISPKNLPHSGPILLFRKSKCTMAWFVFKTSLRAWTPRSWLPTWFHFKHTLVTLLPERSACASTTKPSARMLLPLKSIVLRMTFSLMYLAMALQPSSPMEAYASDSAVESFDASRCANNEGGDMPRGLARRPAARDRLRLARRQGAGLRPARGRAGRLRPT
mmetsp:Transcript_106412/g.298002  ORF Transcript_106412/g.298002 Transcript_106412/m.298002 type:complete len:299 (+) Transcript_106412:747-1643(+)